MVSFITFKVLDNLPLIPFKLLASLKIASDTNHTSDRAHILPMRKGLPLCKVSHEFIFLKNRSFYLFLKRNLKIYKEFTEFIVFKMFPAVNSCSPYFRVYRVV